jgi:hypothetical protein
LSTSLVARVRDAAARALGAARTPRRRTRVAALTAIFLLALAVRSLYALDLAPVMYSRVQPGTRMAWRYDEAAVGIRRGEGILWPREPDPARTGLLARPPGYPLYLALVYGTLGRSFFAAQLVQNRADLRRLRPAHPGRGPARGLGRRRRAAGSSRACRRTSRTARTSCCPTPSPRCRCWPPSACSRARHPGPARPLVDERARRGRSVGAGVWLVRTSCSWPPFSPP